MCKSIFSANTSEIVLLAVFRYTYY